MTSVWLENLSRSYVSVKSAIVARAYSSGMGPDQTKARDGGHGCSGDCCWMAGWADLVEGAGEGALGMQSPEDLSLCVSVPWLEALSTRSGRAGR